MGYYIEGPTCGKADYIVKQHGGRKVSLEEAVKIVDDPNQAVIVVKDNGMFEAAGFMYDRLELERFTQPSDYRPTQFVVMDKAKAKELSRYRG